MVIKNTKIKRQKLQIFLEKRGIQTRTIFTGNILRQPMMKNKKYFKHKNSSINSNYNEKWNAYWMPPWPYYEKFKLYCNI